MSMTIDQDRIQPRYALLEAFCVEVEVERDERPGETLRVVATVLNLSANGAKLAVPQAMGRDETFRIRLAVDRLGLNFYLWAQVCWAAPDGAACIVGCRFTPDLPEGILQQLAEGMRLDRRDRDRLKTCAKVGIVRENSRFWSRETGRLHNYATGGVCVETDRTAKLGETVTLRLDKKHRVEVPVVVRWVAEQDDRYLMGCEYADPQSFARMQDALA